jgi:hypothetical protein
MFATKSNAGLDLDMKPPTAEITISRKEAVIEPSFEKGQAPPVMASFKPRVGFGNGFKNYFLGVDQTFAGGDAAKIMSALYDAPTVRAPIADDPSFDSKITLSKPVTGSSIWPLTWFTKPAGPGDERPLIFGTDTMLGLKVAWSGVGGQFPDTLKAGFNRKEFAWAPLSATDNGKTMKMPAFLATIQSRIAGGNPTNSVGSTNNDQGGGISAIQYFATGEAARNLAFQHDVRDAMLSRLDPHYRRTHAGANAIVLRQILEAMNNAFSQLSRADPIAKAYYDGFSDLKDIQLPDSFETAKPPMHVYTRSPGPPDVLTQRQDQQIVHTPTLTLPNLIAFLATLDISREALSHTLANVSTVQLSITAANGVAGGAHAITPAEARDLQAQLDIQNQAYDSIGRAISENQLLDGALYYFRSLTR